MRIKKLLVLSLLFSAGIFFRGDSAFAAVKTWDGGGSDDNMATAANWDADTAPVSGDSIVLPLGVLMPTCATVELINDLNASSVTLAGLSVTGVKPADCYDELIISGNEIKSSGNVDGGTYGIRIESNFTASGNITVTNTDFYGNLAFGSYNVTLGDYTRPVTGVTVTGSGTLTLSGQTQGNYGGGCGDGTYSSAPFSGDSSGFTGAIVIDGVERGVSIGSAATAFGRSASSITVNNGGYIRLGLSFDQDTSFNTPLTLNGGTMSASQAYKLVGEDCVGNSTIKTVTISSNVTVTAAVSVNYLGKANIHFGGTVTGKDYLSVVEGSDGELSFADGTKITSTTKTVTIDNVSDCSNAYNASTGNTILVVKVDCSATWTSSTFSTGGILKGTGKMGRLSILAGGTLAPGLSPGCLSSGNLAFAASSTFQAELGGTTACTLYDQQVVTGTVTLGNATLSALRFNNYKFVAGSTFTIIDNDAADAITGTFNNLAEGATFKTDDGSVLKISYVGGNGNDVVLTVISVGTPDTGFGLLMNNPIATLAATTLAAGAILVMSRRLKFAPKRSRR